MDRFTTNSPYWRNPDAGRQGLEEAFDWPTEGENFVVWVRYQAVNRSEQPAEAKIEVKLDPQAGLHPNVEAPKEPAVDLSLHGQLFCGQDAVAGRDDGRAARFAFSP